VSIFVGNLPFRAEREDVLQLFASYGEVTNCSLPLERDTGRKRGFAFVEMADEALESAAIEALQGSEMMGRPLRINKAEPRGGSQRRNYSPKGGGGNNSNYGGGSYNSAGGGYGGGYGSSQNSGGYVDQNSNFGNRTSGAKGWEDRSYGDNSENSEYETGRSRRRRGAANDVQSEVQDN
tara:strand:+ start:103 stop:639 length:537 start_codon:yes stop_codon:yes gene_type:complete